MEKFADAQFYDITRQLKEPGISYDAAKRSLDYFKHNRLSGGKNRAFMFWYEAFHSLEGEQTIEDIERFVVKYVLEKELSLVQNPSIVVQHAMMAAINQARTKLDAIPKYHSSPGPVLEIAYGTKTSDDEWRQFIEDTAIKSGNYDYVAKIVGK